MKKLLMAALAAFTLTSCVDSDDNATQSTQQWTYANCFNSVTDLVTSSTTQTQQPKYTITIVTANNGSAGVKISMSNVKLGDDISMTSFDLPEMPLTISNNPTAPWSAEARDVVPANVNASTVIFDYVRFKMLARIIYNQDNPGSQPQQRFVYKLEFKVNGRYVVSAIPTQSLLFGTTASTSADGVTYTTKEPNYAVTVDPEKMLATIDITGAKFVEKMPAMNMSFPKIPCSILNGKLVLKSDALTPTIKGVEYPNYPITDLAATIDPCTSGSLDFTCTMERLGAYTVHVDLVELLTAEK